MLKYKYFKSDRKCRASRRLRWKSSSTFRANEPADTEALQLTCRRFRDTILQNVNTLPTRLVCGLVFDRFHQVQLNLPPANNNYAAWMTQLAKSGPNRQEIREMYEMFARKSAIRKVSILVPGGSEPNGRLTWLIENFPSVKGAASLYVDINAAAFVLPTDPVLDRFERLETMRLRTRVGDKVPSFWSDLFGTKAFRRVSTFRMMNLSGCPAVDDRELFDFITDFSRMPAGKPRVVEIEGLDGDSVRALERRFNESIDSIGGQVCAIIKGPLYDDNRYLTNMAVGSQKQTLAQQLLRDA